MCHKQVKGSSKDEKDCIGMMLMPDKCMKKVQAISIEL